MGKIYSRFCEPIMYGYTNLDLGALLSGPRKNVNRIIATKDYDSDKSVKSCISVNVITYSVTISVGLNVIL